jgi:hypothetical protein
MFGHSTFSHSFQNLYIHSSNFLTKKTSYISLHQPKMEITWKYIYPRVTSCQFTSFIHSLSKKCKTTFVICVLCYCALQLFLTEYREVVQILEYKKLAGKEHVWRQWLEPRPGWPSVLKGQAWQRSRKHVPKILPTHSRSDSRVSGQQSENITLCTNEYVCYFPCYHP